LVLHKKGQKGAVTSCQAC